MTEFKAALLNEIEKLYKKKKVAVALIISLLIIVMEQLIMVGLRNGIGVRGVSSMEFPILVLSLVVNTILPLFTALVTIDSFCGEFSNNTMKITLTRPISRFQLFTAKLIAIMSFILVNLVIVMIFSLVTGYFFNVNSFAFQNVYRIVIAYIVTLMPMVILSIIIAFFCNIISSGIGTFFLTIFIFAILKGIGLVFPRFSGMLFTSMMDWYNLFMMDTIPIFNIFLEFMMMMSYAILFFTAGYYMFDKKEI